MIKKRRKIDSDHDENSAREELKSERYLLGKSGRKQRKADLLGDEFAENLDSGDENINDLLDDIDSQWRPNKKKKKRLGLPQIPLEAHYESSNPADSAEHRKGTERDPHLRKTPKPGDKRKSRKLVPNDSGSNTFERQSKRSGKRVDEETARERESFMDEGDEDVIRQTLDGADD